MATTYKDLDYEFTIDVAGNISEVKDVESIKQSIKSILSTVPGERFMLPEFGSGLKFLIFEPMDEITANDMLDEVETAIETWEDRAIITNINVIADFDKNGYEISVDFLIVITGQEGNFAGFVRSENV